MSIYAISDLHLSFYDKKDMSIFSDIWENHFEKIRINWQKKIKNDDLVLISGDTSWAKKLQEAMVDLDFINSLNGKKVIGYGNHDFWWNSTAKLNSLYENTFFLKNNFYIYNDYIICGTRGWLCPNDSHYSDNDEKIYLKEAKRLERNIQNIMDKNLEIIVLMHYPPTNDKLENSLFLEILDKYNIKTIVYGHLHGNFNRCLKNERFYLTSGDYLEFNPIKIKY